MSRDLFNSVRAPNEFKIGGISDAISAAFGNPVLPPKPNSSESRTRKRLTSLKEKANEKETFLTEAEMNEVEEQMANQEYNPLSYEEMINEVENLTRGMKNRNSDLAELRMRINKCQADIDVREAGFVGIDKTLHDIHSQNKVLMKKIKSVATFSQGNTN